MKKPEGTSVPSNIIPIGVLETKRIAREAKKGLAILPPAKANLVGKALGRELEGLPKGVIVDRHRHDIALLVGQAQSNTNVIPPRTEKAHKFGRENSSLATVTRRMTEYKKSYADACEWGVTRVLQIFFDNERLWNVCPTVYFAYYEYLVRNKGFSLSSSWALPATT